ncbi:sulfatase-like hydrolase/transferase [Daejeonella sp.]|uniref:sulfatase-like hydrolase/transferase n=1 Tax=Daejeonella sp. TaxID=2805397 RepID=UPI0030BEBE0B
MKYNLMIVKLAVLLVIGTAAFGQKKPNIILIMADDIGMEAFGAYGNDDKITPNVDKLAAEGMLFKNCYSTPLCTPSRVELMTGKYNHRNYVGFGLLDPKEKTFGHYMKDLGYTTLVAGKWQLLGNEKQVELAKGATGSYPHQAGFDRFAVWQVDKLGSRYKDPMIYTDERKSKVMKGAYGDEYFTSYIEKFISESRKEPFFIYYPMALTHDPFQPTPFSADFKTGDTTKLDDPKYFKDMVRFLDHLVGRITKKLDETGIREETIIMFIGDNGTSPQIVSRFKGTNYRGAKGQTIERGTHVPMIVNWKGKIKAGTVNNSLVDFSDFLPTLLDLGGSSAKKLPFTDGLSFYPQLTGNMSQARPWVFTFYEPNWGKYVRKAYVHNKDWKLYETGEIYDLNKDPDELKSLTKAQLNASAMKTIGEFETVIANKMKK